MQSYFVYHLTDHDNSVNRFICIVPQVQYRWSFSKYTCICAYAAFELIWHRICYQLPSCWSGFGSSLLWQHLFHRLWSLLDVLYYGYVVSSRLSKRAVLFTIFKSLGCVLWLQKPFIVEVVAIGKNDCILLMQSNVLSQSITVWTARQLSEPNRWSICSGVVCRAALMRVTADHQYAGRGRKENINVVRSDWCFGNSNSNTKNDFSQLIIHILFDFYFQKLSRIEKNMFFNVSRSIYVICLV